MFPGEAYFSLDYQRKIKYKNQGIIGASYTP